MQISDKGLFCIFALLTGFSPAAAQESALNPSRQAPGYVETRPLAKVPSAAEKSAAMPLVPFTSAREALRAWFRDKTAGDDVGAVRALEYAAGQGNLAAQFKLGRMYALGDGAPHNDLKAFEYYSRIADENADESPGTVDGRMVAGAFVALGEYFLTGIKSTYVQPNAQRAFDMFHYSASYFGDPDGQFQLGQLYLKGIGAPKNDRQAARWLKLAAEKGHVGARAVFGDLLFRGGEGVARQGAQGLMWLNLARESAEPDRDSWIIALHEQAQTSVSTLDREAADLLMRRYLASEARARQ